MALKNTSHSYGSIAKAFHWVVAICVIGMIIVGFLLDAIPTPERYTIIQLHKSIGFTLLIVMTLRLFWRFLSPPPPLPGNVSRWQVIVAKMTHGMLYVSTFTMTISGWMMSSFYGYAINWFFLVKIPIPVDEKNRYLARIFSNIHDVAAWVFVVLICVHTLAALKHHFIDRDSILTRMLPGDGNTN